jgi:uncharacterized protein involved in tolerance to divalent cations
MKANTKVDLEAMSSPDIGDGLTNINKINVGEEIGDMGKRLMDIERTRHLIISHNLSTVANHSHLVFMVACLYDPACFYTDSGYEQLTKRWICVQVKAETPSVYMVVRSSSSDKEQLCYVKTREECLQDLAEPRHDEMSFFHRYTPQLLLDTLVEIQEIAYSSEVQRTTRSVIRFHNHA